MAGGPHRRALLLLALPLLGVTCKRAAPPTPGVQVDTTVLFVSAAANSSAPDGSSSHPFATVQQALSRAPDGALVSLGAGSYEGPIVVSRSLVLAGAGAGSTRVELPPDAFGPVVAAEGTALELRDLTVAGATVGIAAARGSLRLRNVVVERQSQTALTAVASDVDISGGSVRSVGSGKWGRGVVLEQGTLNVQRTVFREAGRRAIELRGTNARLVDVDGGGSAVSIVQALDGSEVKIEGGTFAEIGGPALFASGSTLRASRVRISRAEYGALVHRNARLELHDAQISDTKVAGAALVQSDGEVVGTTIHRGGTEAAVSVTNSLELVKLEGNRIGDPGSLGLHATNATIVATDNVFSGAVHDRQGDFGDGVFAVECNLTLLRNGFEGNAGSGATLIRSQAHLVGNRFVSNGRAGLVLLDRSTAKAQANEFTANRGPGVTVAERSHAMVARNRFADSGAAEVEAPCGGGGEIDLRTNDFLGPAAPRGHCP